MGRPAASAAHAHAYALADLNAADQRNAATHEHADKGADMDGNNSRKPNADEHEHAYIDRHGNRVTYRHVHIFPAVKHAPSADPSANLAADNYRDIDGNADLHEGAVVPAGDELEREGAKM